MKSDFVRYIADLVGRGSRVLDVGCGSGELLRELVRQRGALGLGVDPSAADRNEGSVQFKSLKAEDIGELEGPFELIYTLHSLHHFQDVERFLKGASKVLQDGGQLIVIDWKRGADTGVPEEYFTAEEVVELMEKAGFEVLERYMDGDSFVIRARKKK